MPDVSRQWQSLNAHEFSCVDKAFLESFRAPGSTDKFVAWNPLETSTRYFKFLLLNSALRQPPEFFEAYRKLENRELGQPLTVRCAGCDVDADYLAAVEEWDFLRASGALSGVGSVVEIGGGFGRTCHALLTLCPQIERYVIVDLAPMLELSQAYLARVLPNARVRFIRHDDRLGLDSLEPDLVINIDSFQEMPPSAISFYMTHVVRRARRFYCKNPVGKYSPSAVGLSDLPSDRLLDVFQLGYCQDLIDIFDDGVLSSAYQESLTAYLPPSVWVDSTECAYKVAASMPMDLFPFYLHALYVR